MAEYTLFVSCVPGSVVRRWGTKTFIGAERDIENPRVMHYSPETIVAISAAEHGKYRREYNRAIRSGALQVHTEEDWRRSLTPSKKTKTKKGQGAASSKAHKVSSEDSDGNQSSS